MRSSVFTSNTSFLTGIRSRLFPNKRLLSSCNPPARLLHIMQEECKRIAGNLHQFIGKDPEKCTGLVGAPSLDGE